MVEIHRKNRIQTVSNCIVNIGEYKIRIVSRIDPNHIIFEYDIDDVEMVVVEGKITYKKYKGDK